jgi:aspartate aminotransferase-like enzyme
LEALGLDIGGDPPLAIVRLPGHIAEAEARRSLLEQFGIHVTSIAPQTWRFGLLGADARPDAAHRVITAVEHVLRENAHA